MNVEERIQGMSEIYFIRHGQASFGSRNYDQLSPTGIRQAQIVADYLNGLGMGFDAVYSGRMQRQQDTARPLCAVQATTGGDDDPTVLPAFDEYDAGSLLKARTRVSRGPGAVTADALATLRRDKKTFQAYFTDTVHGWLNGDYDGVDGVEPWPVFQARVRAGVADIMTCHRNGCRVAVFTSGGPISVALQMALELSDAKTVDMNWQIMNASLTCIKYNPSGLILSFFNNTTPLLLARDPALLTYR